MDGVELFTNTSQTSIIQIFCQLKAMISRAKPYIKISATTNLTKQNLTIYI
jgi:hypothetical protein